MSIEISIILPVFNTQNYLEQALDSILNQAFASWEIIAINDASVDDSLKILKKYEQKDSRINVINLTVNKGLGYVRNLGIEKARGNFLSFLDSDDYFAPGAFDFLFNKIRKLPKTNIFVWGFSTCNDRGEILKTYFPSKPNRAIGDTLIKLGMLGRKGLHAFAWVYIVKRTFVQKNSISFAEDVYYEDIHFSTQLLFYAQKVSIIKKKCYHYRRHTDSITGNSSKQKIDDKFAAFTWIKTFLEEKGVFQRYQSLYLARFLALCVHTSFNEYFVLPKSERDQELDDYMLKIRKSKLLRKENLLLLRNIGLSFPKNEKAARKAYLGAYYGLKAIKNRYRLHRFMVRAFSWVYRKRMGLH